jgi:cyanophycin synthetase
MRLDNPRVSAAVLETARGGILRAGLGFDRCDVAVVLNVAADHLGLRGVHTIGQLAEVKGIVPAAVAPGGWAVLNADDRLVLGMRARTAGRIALFSTRPPGACAAFEAQLAAGGVCARVEDEEVVLYDGTMRHVLAGVAELPLTLGGAARFQLQNVLAAALAAHVQGVPVEELRTGLREFAACPERTPGRLNVLRVGRGHVVVDYAHNAPAVAALLDFVHRFDARRSIGVVAVPGDRRDADVRAVGRLCAAFDHVIVKEDTDRRGRAPGEIPRLLHDGLREGGLADAQIEHVPAESDAVARAIARLGGGEVAVILAEDVPAVLAQVLAAADAAGAPHTGAPA